MTEIKVALLDSDDKIKAFDRLFTQHEDSCEVLKTTELSATNEATRSTLVFAFMLKVTWLFRKDLYFVSKEDLSGRCGHGPVDCLIHSRRSDECTLGVTERFSTRGGSEHCAIGSDLDRSEAKA